MEDTVDTIDFLTIPFHFSRSYRRADSSWQCASEQEDPSSRRSPLGFLSGSSEEKIYPAGMIALGLVEGLFYTGVTYLIFGSGGLGYLALGAIAGNSLDVFLFTLKKSGVNFFADY